VWLLWSGFTLFLVWAYPAWIAPIFNKFTPLKDNSVRERIQALLERTGFRSRGIFVMDGSRRSAHGNAYFTGFGKSKRIVFFDTLLEHLGEKEIEAVLAHELGHFKRRHIVKRMLLTFGMSLSGLALLGWLITQPWFYAGLGMTQPSTHAALMLFMLVVPVFTFFLQPLFAWGSRRYEYEADSFAAEQTDARDLVNALVKLYKENASTLTPDPLHSAFYDSHPPAALRIAHLAGKT
jgi:STE24 endopeptidase